MTETPQETPRQFAQHVADGILQPRSFVEMRASELASGPPPWLGAEHYAFLLRAERERLVARRGPHEIAFTLRDGRCIAVDDLRTSMLVVGDGKWHGHRRSDGTWLSITPKGVVAGWTSWATMHAWHVHGR